MDFLKKLFGGGSVRTTDGRSQYFYVKPRGCDEIVRVRIDTLNDLSLNDAGNGYYVRKLVRGTQCFQQAELELFYNINRQLSDQTLTGGDLVSEDAYAAWETEQENAGQA